MLANGGHVSSAKANRPDHHLIDFTTAMLVIAAAFPIIFIVLRVMTTWFSNGNGGRFFVYRPMLNLKLIAR
jgi:hypothetical protein